VLFTLVVSGCGLGDKTCGENVAAETCSMEVLNRVGDISLNYSVASGQLNMTISGVTRDLERRRVLATSSLIDFTTSGELNIAMKSMTWAADFCGGGGGRIRRGCRDEFLQQYDAVQTPRVARIVRVLAAFNESSNANATAFETGTSARTADLLIPDYVLKSFLLVRGCCTKEDTFQEQYGEFDKYVLMFGHSGQLHRRELWTSLF